MAEQIAGSTWVSWDEYKKLLDENAELRQTVAGLREIFEDIYAVPLGVDMLNRFSIERTFEEIQELAKKGMDYNHIPDPGKKVELLERVAEAAEIHRAECLRIGKLLDRMASGDKEAFYERKEKGNNIGKTARALDDALAALKEEKE